MIIKINEGTEFERKIGNLDLIQKTFYKKLKKSKHLFRKFDAWGIDASYFNEVILPNNYSILIMESEEKLVYEATPAIFQKHGVNFHFKGYEDHQAQIFLPRNRWVVSTFGEIFVENRPYAKFLGIKL